MKKRLISLLLAFSMVISLLPVGAFADNDTVNIWITDNYPDASQKGTQAVSLDQTGGDWYFTPSADPSKPEDGVLTLCGNGKSYNFGINELDCKVVIYSRVSRCSTIDGGYFNNSVECQGGVEIRSGMYYNSVTLTPHTDEYTNFITNGTFWGNVIATGTQITNGSFFGNVTLYEGTTIQNGTANGAVPRFFSGSSAGSQPIVKNFSGVIAGGRFWVPVEGEVTCGIFQEKPAQIAAGSHTWTLTTKSGTYGFNAELMPLTSGSPLYVVGTDARNDLAYDPTARAKYINGSEGSAYHNGTQYSIKAADGGDAGTLYLCKTNGSYRPNFYLFEIKGDATVAFEEILNPLVIDESGYPDLSNGGTLEVTASETNNVWAFTPSPTENPADGVLTLYKGEFNLQNPVTCKVALSGTSSSSYASIADGIFKNTVTVNENSFLVGGIYAGDVVLSTSNTYLHSGLFATLPTGLKSTNHYWKLTASGDDHYMFNDALTLDSTHPLYLASSYANEGYHSFTAKITDSDLNYANRIEIKNTATTIYENDTRCGTIKRVTGGYSFDLGASATVLLQSSLLSLEIEADGYPNGTAGGTTAKSGDGWSFTPSTDAAHPENGVLTLTGSDMDLGSTPVACKVVLSGTSSSNYASIASGEFNNTVTLEKYATLKNGTYNGAVSFNSPTTSITNGTFNAEVKTDYRQFDNDTPKISGGAFNSAVDFPQGVYISGGTFEAPVTTENGFSCISGGIFKDTVTVSKGYVSGGIFAGTVTLSESGGRYGGLYQELPNETLDDGSEATTLIWTLTTSGEDSYTFNDLLTLDSTHRLYLAAPSDSYNYEFYITGSNLKYANQIKISDNTTITADGAPCGSITAATNRYEFALSQSATVLLQSALDPLEIDETGYPKGTEGGAIAKSGEGWSYAPYMAPAEGAAKGLLTLTEDGANSGIFNTINSDQPALCDVVVNANVTLRSGSFAGTVTNYGILDGGTFSGKVTVKLPRSFRNYPTIKSGTFTEASNVTLDSSYTYIEGGTFRGTVTNKGRIKGGAFYDTVTNVAHAAGEYAVVIETGEFYGPVINNDYIQNGTFTGEVTNSGTIRDGTFGGIVTNNNTVNGGTFNGEVLNGASGTLKSGTFTGSVTNNGRIVGSDSTYTGSVTNRGTIESGTFEGSVKNYGTLMGGTFSGEVQNDIDPDHPDRSGIICFSTEDGVYAPPLFTETSTVTNTGATIQDGTFLGTVNGMVEGGVYVQKPTSEKPISRMTYRYQGSDGNGKAGALTINYKIPDAAYVVNSDTTHVFVTLTNLASPLVNINGETFSETTCGPTRTWALHGKLPNNDEPIILNKATSLAAGDLIVNLPGGESHKVVYNGQPHEATIELVSDALDYLLDKYETVQTEDGGRALKIYYRYPTGERKADPPTEIGTYEVLYKKIVDQTYYGNGRVFEITENSHSVTVTDGFIVKVEHPGAADTNDTTGDGTTEEPISTATVQYGDKVTVTIDASKFPSGMVFDRWETTPVDLPLIPADGESYKTVTFTMPAEDVTLRAVPCTVEEKAASGGSSPLGTAALVVVGGAAAGVLVWQGYELGTELYLHSVLPSGVAIPETRGQLAVVLWQAAGSPAPAAPLAPDAADTQKALAWVVEHALLEDKTGNFDPREPVNKTEVIRAWNKLNHQGLAKQAK